MNNRLKDIREDNDLKQSDVANVLGIGQSDYSKYERGANMMGIDKYITLAKFYNISIDYLVGIIPTPYALDRTKKMLSIEDEKILTAYHEAPKNIQNAIKTLLKI